MYSYTLTWTKGGAVVHPAVIQKHHYLYSVSAVLDCMKKQQAMLSFENYGTVQEVRT